MKNKITKEHFLQVENLKFWLEGKKKKGKGFNTGISTL